MCVRIPSVNRLDVAKWFVSVCVPQPLKYRKALRPGAVTRLDIDMPGATDAFELRTPAVGPDGGGRQPHPGIVAACHHDGGDAETSVREQCGDGVFQVGGLGDLRATAGQQPSWSEALRVGGRHQQHAGDAVLRIASLSKCRHRREATEAVGDQPDSAHGVVNRCTDTGRPGIE